MKLLTSDYAATPISFAKCYHWYFTSTALKHQSGRFFSVQLVSAGDKEHVYINQPEVGILGVALTFDNMQKHWLLQLKPEPGNVGYVQFAPTVQATKSNYERVHGGAETPLLSFFTSETINKLVSVSGSEQGDRFLNKFNRNIKVILPISAVRDFPTDSFKFVTNKQLKELLQFDYILNTDARSVIASGYWHLLAKAENKIFLDGICDSALLRKALHHSYHIKRQDSFSHCLGTLKKSAAKKTVIVKKLAWNDSKEFYCSEDGVYKTDGERILGYYDCLMPSREVERWQQPLLEKASISFYATPLMLKNDSLFIGLRAEAELGFLGRAEFTTYIKTECVSDTQLCEQFYGIARSGTVLLSIKQSDEGGRFWRNEGIYQLFLLKQTSKALVGDDIVWVSLGELETLTLQEGIITNELRTMISLLLSLA